MADVAKLKQLVEQFGAFYSVKNPDRYHTLAECTEGNNIENHYLGGGKPPGTPECDTCRGAGHVLKRLSQPQPVSSVGRVTTFAEMLGLKT